MDSSGVETSFSTSSAEDPGAEMRMSATGTMICGSSSRGVSARAANPARKLAMSSSSDSFEVMNSSTMREVIPRSVFCRVSFINGHPR